MGYAIVFGILCLCGIVEGMSKPSYGIQTGKKSRNKAHDNYIFFIDT